MSRLPLRTVAQAPEQAREFMLRRGSLNVFALLANAPRVFPGWSRMTDQLLDSPTFTPRTRELVILRVARCQSSPYEITQHRDLARRAGLTDRQINAVIGGAPASQDGFDATELAVLDLTTQLCTTHRVGDRAFSTVRAALGVEATTELLMLISLYYGLALVLNATDLDIDETSRLRS